MSELLRKLLDQGYEIRLTSGGSVDHDEYYARLHLGGGPVLTGEGTTPELAVWAASPLHGDDEPLPELPKAAPHFAFGGERHCQALDGNYACTSQADHAMPHLAHVLGGAVVHTWIDASPVIDSHVWDCAKCGGQCIGPEPVNGVCRGCGGVADNYASPSA